MTLPAVTQCVKGTVAGGSSGTINNFATWVAGRSVVVAMPNFSSSESSLGCSDNINGTYNAVRASIRQGPNAALGMFARHNVSGSIVKLAWTSRANGITIIAYGISNIDTTSLLIGTNTSVSTTTTVGANGVDPGAIDAITLMCSSIDQGGTVTITNNVAGSTPSSGWAEFNASAHEFDGNNFMVGNMVYLATSTSGTRNHVESTSASNDKASIIASFRGVSSATPVSDPPRPLTARMPLLMR